MIILFDGTPSRPLGKQLFVEEYPRRSIDPVPVQVEIVWGEMSSKIRSNANKLRTWKTLQEIALIVGFHADRIESTIGSFVRQGLMEREIEGHGGGRHLPPQRWRWVKK